jgi:hypothetical protein
MELQNNDGCKSPTLFIQRGPEIARKVCSESTGVIVESPVTAALNGRHQLLPISARQKLSEPGLQMKKPWLETDRRIQQP